MTEKRFVGNFYKGMLISIYDKVDDKNVNILQMVEIANQVVNENEQLKQRVNSRLHFYRELYDSTKDIIAKRVVEDLEDILKR